MASADTVAAGQAAPSGRVAALQSSRRVDALVLAGLAIVALAIRLVKFRQGVYADELSTLYIVDGRSLSDVLDIVSSDAEVSPPLSFIASWLFSKLGSAPELIRLPSMIAGLLSIPLTYLVGLRAVNRATGLIAAAIVTLSPFMVYFSAEARGYALAIFFLLLSTLALLRAVRSGGWGWWVAYALASTLAMYSHYTAAFPLVAQLAWALWTFPGLRLAAVGANLGALVLYLPWVPGFLDDRASPTIKLVEAFAASGLGPRVDGLAAWAFGGPFLPPGEFPGTLIVAIGAVGVAAAAVAALVRAPRASGRAGPAATDHGVELVIALGLAAPVLELAVGILGGPEIFGSRNIGVSSAGMALAIGALVSLGGRPWGWVGGATVLAAFAAAAATNLGSATAKPDFPSAASWIDARAEPGDVIVDVHDVRSTPVPLTPLDTYINGSFETFRPLLPVGPPPFLPFTSDPPPPDELLADAFEKARGHRVFVLGLEERMVTDGSALTGVGVGSPTDPESEVFDLPAGARTIESIELPGLRDLGLFLVEDPGR